MYAGREGGGGEGEAIGGGGVGVAMVLCSEEGGGGALANSILFPTVTVSTTGAVCGKCLLDLGAGTGRGGAG